jgi:uncharacterized SAM-binding protein YcdF (DUF218 family)
LTDVYNVHNRVVVRKHRGTIAAVVALILAAAAVMAFRGVGRWLVVEDPPDRADAIVVLSGGLPDRALEAAKVFRLGMAPQVWLTRPANPAAELSKMGISFEGEEGYSRAILIYEGVPESAIRILAPEIVNTEDEERAIIAEMERTRAARVIIVTSPPHTRRVRALWRRIAPAGLSLTVRSATEYDYDADHWWRTTRDSLSVMREVMGLVNVWAGLPVRSASH